MKRMTIASVSLAAVLAAASTVMVAALRTEGGRRQQLKRAALDPSVVREAARQAGPVEQAPNAVAPLTPRSGATERSERVARSPAKLAQAALSAASRPDELAARWEAEEPDPRATDDLMAHISGALNDLAVDGELDEITCRKTLCRVNVHFADMLQALRFESEAGMSSRREKIDVSVTDGIVDVEVYLARE